MVKKSLLILNRIKSLSSKINQIISYFPDPDDILRLKVKDYKKLALFKKQDIERLLYLRDSGEIDKELELIHKEEVEVLDITSPEYPALLKEIGSPPPILYIKGNKKVLSKLCFAIVGTRLPTLYGLEMAEKFSFGLASLGFVVVSGLARGIDTAAHKAALKAGKTVAVLGSGLLRIYPRENETLAQMIAQRGALVSEFPIFERPLKENFPRRNRIISGLARGVLVVEAPPRSGALITARYACEQNREVFALPGKADSPQARGTHLLIKEGAKLVDSISDILGELNIKLKEGQHTGLELTPNEKVIFDLVGKGGVCLEELFIKSNLGRDTITKTILSLQVKGLVKEVRPLFYAKAKL
jgi:DNA processing protein